MVVRVPELCFATSPDGLRDKSTTYLVTKCFLDEISAAFLGRCDCPFDLVCRLAGVLFDPCDGCASDLLQPREALLGVDGRLGVVAVVTVEEELEHLALLEVRLATFEDVEFGEVSVALQARISSGSRVKTLEP